MSNSANSYGTTGNKHVVTTTFTSPSNGDTWLTGLSTVEYVGLTIVESTGAAGDGFAVDSISGGTVTLEVVGTVGAGQGFAIGV